MSSAPKNRPATYIITPKLRVLFVNVFEPLKPNKSEPDKAPVAGLQVLIPKSNTEFIAEIHEKMKIAKTLKFGDKKVPGLYCTLRDGDEHFGGTEHEALYAGHMFMNCNSPKQLPGVIDKNKVEITDPRKFRSGAYAILALNAYGYDTGKSKGVTCGLNNIMVVDEGEFIGGTSPSANEDFGAPVESVDKDPFEGEDVPF